MHILLQIKSDATSQNTTSNWRRHKEGERGGDRRERQRRRDSADRATQRGNETKETERVVETVWILHVLVQ